jgi:hypothetical protein
MAGTIIGETKREGQKMHNLKEPKKGGDLIPLAVGSYLTHHPFNVTCMQIVRFNNNGRLRRNITHECNFLLSNRG